MIVNVEDLKGLKLFNKMKHKPMVVWYYADWCGHCQRMDDDWKKYCENNKDMDNIKIKDNMLQHLKPKPNIRGYPTIEFRYKNNKIQEFPSDQYRTSDNLELFAKENMEKLKKSGYEADNESNDVNSKNIKKVRKKSLKKKSLRKKKRKKNKRSMRRKSI